LILSGRREEVEDCDGAVGMISGLGDKALGEGAVLGLLTGFVEEDGETDGDGEKAIDDDEEGGGSEVDVVGACRERASASSKHRGGRRERRESLP
jgi:hypothetical protein